MRGLMRTASAAALLLANWAGATHATEPVFDLDPMLHAPGGRIVFNRKCADEEPYRVKLVFDSRKSKPVGWVAAGSYPPAAPTVPGVPHSGTRLLR